MKVHARGDGYEALARICYLTEDGEWKWANRRVLAATPEEAEAELCDRLFNIIGCRTQDETNEQTNGRHVGHRPMKS